MTRGMICCLFVLSRSDVEFHEVVLVVACVVADQLCSGMMLFITTAFRHRLKFRWKQLL